MASVVEKECFKTKYGIITVLTTSIFAEWYEDCSLVMSSIGAEGILDGIEIRPTAPVRAVEKYETKLQEAKVVLNGSVERAYKTIARDFSRNDDISGLWNHLMELNPAKTPHFASSLQCEFHKVSFDPKNQTIQEVVNKLQRIHVQLKKPSFDKVTR
ncbi:hypothetical protein K3495_g12638 [Podosphaera aphanis]|nr:hypothetical protein K3495_g12638 [Podosphaera aphanis]